MGSAQNLIESHLDSCPTCHREFEELLNYPFIHINEVEVLSFPAYITDRNPSEFELFHKKFSLFSSFKRMPNKVRNKFKEGEKFIIHKGFVYSKLESYSDTYKKSIDRTESAREAYDDKGVQDFLERLEKLKGRNVRLEDHFRISDTELFIPSNDDEKRNFLISLKENAYDSKHNERKTTLVLNGESNKGTYIFYGFDLRLAQITYQGLVE